MRRFRFEGGGEHKFREQRFAPSTSVVVAQDTPEGDEIRLAVTADGGYSVAPVWHRTLRSKQDGLPQDWPCPGGARRS
jgi:hypothetical protein